MSADPVTDSRAFMEAAGAMLGRGEMPAPATPYAVQWHAAHATLLAELSRLEGENERLQADNDVRSSCLRDTQLALAEARRQIAERDEALLSAAKYLVRMENALLKDDLDMKLDFPGEEGPSAFATTLVPDFDVAAYELELFAGRAPPPTGGAGDPSTHAYPVLTHDH